MRKLFALRFIEIIIIALVLALSPRDGLMADPGTGRLLGTDANGGNLLDINPGTGAAAIIGNMGVGGAPSLATDPTTGIVYVGRGSGNPFLYTVNPLNGSPFLVGDTGLGEAAVGGMDFDSSGVLYAAVNIAGGGGSGSDHLATLDKNTGLATIIGPFGTCSGILPLPVDGSGSCTIEGIESIAFDDSGTLWGVHTFRGSAGPAGLYTINPGTGAATFISPILDVNGDPPSGGLSSIQFACDGTLFGGTASGFGGAGDGGRLVTVNSATGTFSFVGTGSATGRSSLGGLAFEASCPNDDLLTIEKLINHRVRKTPADAAQLLAGTRYRAEYKVTNNSPDHIYGVQVFEGGELVCNMYDLMPGQSKQPARCASNQGVLVGNNNVPATVTATVSGSGQAITGRTNAYYTGLSNVPGMLTITHYVNNKNADTEASAVNVNGNEAEVVFRVENTGGIELYRVNTFHDPFSPVNSGWQQQCFIGTLDPGQVRYCKRAVSVAHAGLNKAFGRAQGANANVSPAGFVNASNPTYFNVLLP